MSERSHKSWTLYLFFPIFLILFRNVPYGYLKFLQTLVFSLHPLQFCNQPFELTRSFQVIVHTFHSPFQRSRYSIPSSKLEEKSGRDLLYFTVLKRPVCPSVPHERQGFLLRPSKRPKLPKLPRGLIKSNSAFLRTASCISTPHKALYLLSWVHITDIISWNLICTCGSKTKDMLVSRSEGMPTSMIAKSNALWLLDNRYYSSAQHFASLVVHRRYMSSQTKSNISPLFFKIPEFTKINSVLPFNRCHSLIIQWHLHFKWTVLLEN